MRLLTGEEMRLLDAAAMEEYGIAGIVLMENAGRAVAQKAVELLAGKPEEKKVVIFVGSGNNGGDGLVAARHIHNAGAEVRLFLLKEPEVFAGDAAENWSVVKTLGLRFDVIKEEDYGNILKLAIFNADLIIDAMFGTGFQGVPKEAAALAIDIINEAQRPVLAVDVPSGVDASTGKVAGNAVLATATVSFAFAKLGLLLPPAAQYVGELQVADISIPKELLELVDVRREYLDEYFCQRWLPKRKADSHKGNYGHVLVVGGHPQMPGAPLLAAHGALKMGAGLVTLATPLSLQSFLLGRVPELLALPLAETDQGGLAEAALSPVLLAAPNKVLVVGMGLGRSLDAKAFVQGLLAQMPAPMVLDADGLYALACLGAPTKNWLHPLICTPHPGEMARLLNISVAEVQADRMGAVQEAAKLWRATMVLKGDHTLISTPSGRLYVNGNGNPGLATGGSGDVLAGFIGALVGQNVPAPAAAACGVFLHGAAGDAAAAHLGQLSLKAGDIIDFLPKILQEYYKA